MDNDKSQASSINRLKRRQEWWKKHAKKDASQSSNPIQNLNSENNAAAEIKPPLKNKSSKRFILFLGNLSYSTTNEDILKHFKKCGHNLQVRLLTKKDGSPRGCAFLEAFRYADYQKALKYHHTSLNERKINVEVTCGGGGNSLTRRNKIQSENEKMRTKLDKK
ncbi:putative RNA-binding protein [Trichoplax sp. H2]|nr:putative RNA-binding protein [Trichoplax sp. H2]|eukprot:RDD39941.1 putative RNA-binding protein [Trichoplax sp. H2]